MVNSGELDHIHISFMVAGHTKFAPDWLFSTIGCAYKTEDVFTIGDLKSICDRSATCHIETGEQIRGGTHLARSTPTFQVYRCTEVP